MLKGLGKAAQYPWFKTLAQPEKDKRFNKPPLIDKHQIPFRVLIPESIYLHGIWGNDHGFETVFTAARALATVGCGLLGGGLGCVQHGLGGGACVIGG